MNNNITEDYVSFECAKLLKEKGFEWRSDVIVMKEGKMAFENTTGVNQSMDNAYNCYEENGNTVRPRKYTKTNTHYPRPTHALAIKWIRENFNYNVEVTYRNADKVYQSLAHPIFPQTRVGLCGHYKTFEEATEAAILYTLTNLI